MPKSNYDYSPTEALSSLVLSRMPGLTQHQAIELIKYYGTAEAALSDSSPEVEQWGKLLSNKSGIAAARERAKSELDFCEQNGIRVIPFSSEDYPALLQADEVRDAPAALFFQGNGNLNCRHILSVVGTRHITDYGKQFCEGFFSELAVLLPDVLIVSGLAYGVDIHAHRAALANNLDTVAVLAHGLDRIYPQMHKSTAAEMVNHGGLLTEYFTGTVPDKGNFVRRNRIVAGMSYATLVVESASHGGALITATLAQGYGREVMAVPGRTTDLYSAGCNQFIRENRAALVTSAADMIKMLGWEAKKKKVRQPQLFPIFTPEQRSVFEALRNSDGLSADRLSLLTGMPVASLSDILFDLEEMNAVKRMAGNRFRIAGDF